MPRLILITAGLLLLISLIALARYDRVAQAWREFRAGWYGGLP